MLLYRLLLTLLSPVLFAGLLLRRLRGRETWADIGQRLGGGPALPAQGPAPLWLHGASNGELASARPLVLALLRDRPGLRLVITANTITGRDMAAGWNLPGVTARLAPLDFRWALRRFRRRTRPGLLAVMENELWPNRIATAPMPVALVGARMSEKSFRTWRRLPGLAAALLARLAFLSAQDADSARRFTALGLPTGAQGPVGTLKSAVDLAPPDPAALAALAQVFDRDDTVLAASTHEGEEAIVLDAFREARATRPALKLILAPRHPPRGDEVAALVARTGLPMARRSAGEAPDADTAVYLADTLGEMPLWYALAGATFVGGSFVPRGGHTPFEPAAAGSAILHGPDTANFRAPYATLDAGGGGLAVADAPSLAAALLALAPARARAAMTSRARDILAGGDDGPALVATLSARLLALLAR